MLGERRITAEQYGEWAQEHCNLFLLSRPEEEAMVASWHASLCGYSLHDLRAASRWVAEHDPPAARTQQLSALLDRLRAVAIDRARKEAAAEPDERPACVSCGGSGLVVVPHVRYVVQGVWQRRGPSWPEMTVYCACPRGDGRRQAHQAVLDERYPFKGLRAWGLGAYEVRVPHWQQLLCDRDNARADERVAHERAAVLDRRYGVLDVARIKERLARALAMPRPPRAAAPGAPAPTAAAAGHEPKGAA